MADASGLGVGAGLLSWQVNGVEPVDAGAGLALWLVEAVVASGKLIAAHSMPVVETET